MIIFDKNAQSSRAPRECISNFKCPAISRVACSIHNGTLDAMHVFQKTVNFQLHFFIKVITELVHQKE